MVAGLAEACQVRSAERDDAYPAAENAAHDAGNGL